MSLLIMHNLSLDPYPAQEAVRTPTVTALTGVVSVQARAPAATTGPVTRCVSAGSPAPPTSAAAVAVVVVPSSVVLSSD